MSRRRNTIVAWFSLVWLAGAAQALPPDRAAVRELSFGPAWLDEHVAQVHLDVVESGEIVVGIDLLRGAAGLDDRADLLARIRPTAPADGSFSFEGLARVVAEADRLLVQPLREPVVFLFTVDNGREDTDEAWPDGVVPYSALASSLAYQTVEAPVAVADVLTLAVPEEPPHVPFDRLFVPDYGDVGGGGSCITSCSVSCVGGGGSCSASCGTGECASCDCGGGNNTPRCNCR